MNEGPIMTRNGGIVSLSLSEFVSTHTHAIQVTRSELQAMPVHQVDLTFVELLETLTPAICQPKMDKKERNKRNKTWRQMRRRQAVKIDENSSNQPKFVLDPDRPWETGKTLTEFHLFKKLAPEIRQMIWLEVFPNAQAVKITEDGLHADVRLSFLRLTHNYIYRAKVTYVPSPLLFVNRESRAMVMSKYPLAFAAQLGGRPIRFNFQKDILYFESPAAMINFYGGTLPNFQSELETFGYKYNMSEVHDKVQHVAVGNVNVYKGVVGGTLNQFRALKTVILGDAKGQDVGEPYDMILDFITGDERLGFGWQRFQNFKTPEDRNMPLVERYRKDHFEKLIKEDYKVCRSVYYVDIANPLQQFVGVKKLVPLPGLEPSKLKSKQVTMARDIAFYASYTTPTGNDFTGTGVTITDVATEDQKLVVRAKRQRGIGIKVNY
jgi:hypothetical protein